MKSHCVFSVCFGLILFSAPAFARGSPNYAWANFVGHPGGHGSVDGSGSAARFFYPRAVTVDSAGNMFVADMNNHTIRKVTRDGEVTTLAGLAGAFGSTDGTGSAARFFYPSGVAVDGAGNLYVADTHNHTIRKITSGGQVTTLAGLGGVSGSADGIGSAARFNKPWGVTVDNAGNLYVADSENHTIRKVTSAGAVSTWAGAAGVSGSSDGSRWGARFYYPSGLAMDSAGNLYVADAYNETIRRMTSEGAVTTLAGSANQVGSADGTGSAARFYYPRGVSVDAAFNVYVADEMNHTIRKVTSGGVVTTLAGRAGQYGAPDGAGSVARFNRPGGVAVDSVGNVFVADEFNDAIRKVTSDAVVTTLAGISGFPGSADGTGSNAWFNLPTGVAVDSAGNLYVADYTNHTIRKVTSGGAVTTLAGLAGVSGSTDGIGGAARFYYPHAVALGSNGDVYVAESGNYTIRKVTSVGVVTTLAGSPGAQGDTDGTGSAARFYEPNGVAAGSAGDLYVADSGNHTIRKVTSAGVVTTFAGLAGVHGINDGTGSTARFWYPRGVAVDTAGNVYVADAAHTIRKITSGGVVTTLAGNPNINIYGYPQGGHADGTGGAARFSGPGGLSVDSTGTLYVADTHNYRIRMVTSGGVVTTIGGNGTAGSTDGVGGSARFALPQGIAVDSAGYLYVADTGNNRISKGTGVDAPFDYIIDNGLLTIIGYTGPGGAVNIPNTINGFPVRLIASRAFAGLNSLTSISIPNSVIAIGDCAFLSCSNLSNVAIGSGVTNIGSYAFEYCAALTSITIPDNVATLGIWTFAYCANLTFASLGNGLRCLQGGEFISCTRLTSVMLGTNVTCVGPAMFAQCTSLSGVTLPESVTNIGPSAFAGSALLGLTIPERVTAIGDNAFTGCNLGTITIPDSVVSIGDQAFWSCRWLATAVVGRSVASIAYSAFAACPSLIGVYFRGDAPGGNSDVFGETPNVTVYYLPGTAGWGATFSGRPTALWPLPYPVIVPSGSGFGTQSNVFAFRIAWASNLSVVVEACAALAHPTWVPVSTNPLTGGWSYFADLEWTNFSGRFYRVRWP